MEQLSIIIPMYNEEKYIGKVLSHIANQTYNGDLEVIVVDNNSADNSIQKAQEWAPKFKQFHLIKESKQGAPAARNKGAELAIYENLLFMDSDIFLPPNFLKKFMNKVKNKKNLTCLVFHLPEKFNILDYLWVVFVQGYVCISQWITPICCGSFLYAPKSIHMKIRGFNENVVLGDDVEYGYRLCKAGAKYKFFWFPIVKASPRRLRQTGRLKLFFLWARGYVFMLLFGPMYINSKVEYPFGIYKGD